MKKVENSRHRMSLEASTHEGDLDISESSTTEACSGEGDVEGSAPVADGGRDALRLRARLVIAVGSERVSRVEEEDGQKTRYEG